MSESLHKRGRPPVEHPRRLRAIRVADGEWIAWHKWAKCDGKTLSGWIRDIAAREGSVIEAAEGKATPNTAAPNGTPPERA